MSTSPGRWGTTDRTGLFTLKPHTHVKITHPRHAYYGQTGTVVRVEHPKVWVALPNGVTAKCGHRSVEALP